MDRARGILTPILLLALCALPACGSPDPVLELMVSPIQPEAVYVRVTLTVNGTSNDVDFSRIGATQWAAGRSMTMAPMSMMMQSPTLGIELPGVSGAVGIRVRSFIPSMTMTMPPTPDKVTGAGCAKTTVSGQEVKKVTVTMDPMMTDCTP